MRKHEDPKVTAETRISIFTCSSGSAWKLVAGKHPFGKAGGTRGSVKTGENGGEPRIPWVDAIVVGGSKRGDRVLVEEALRIANEITTMDSGPAFAWGLEATRKLHAVLRIENEKEFARAVENLVSEWGKEHAREHKREMSQYPSMPPTDYRKRERARKNRVAEFMKECHCCGQKNCDGKCEDLRPRSKTEAAVAVAEEKGLTVIMEEVKIVRVADVMSDGSIIPSLNSDDCIQ